MGLVPGRVCRRARELRVRDGSAAGPIARGFDPAEERALPMAPRAPVIAMTGFPSARLGHGLRALSVPVRPGYVRDAAHPRRVQAATSQRESVWHGQYAER